MGCEVQLSTEQPYFRTDFVLLASLIHIVRAIIFIALSIIPNGAHGAVAGIGFIEFVAAWWLWSLKVESWGVSMGISVFHILFPAALGISWLATTIIVLVSFVQCLILGIIRQNGGYSFERIASVDTQERKKLGGLQKNIFSLAVIAQLLKAFFVLLGFVMLFPVLGLDEPIPWLGFFPVTLSILILGVTDVAAGLGMYLGRDWGYQLTVIMVPVSFVETILTLMAPIFLIGVWILLLLNTCLAKDGFYYKLVERKQHVVLAVIPKK